MPQLVAAFHSFVGAAATLTAAAEYMGMHGAELNDNVMKSAIFLAASIGAMTFSGSLVAFGKVWQCRAVAVLTTCLKSSMECCPRLPCVSLDATFGTF